MYSLTYIADGELCSVTHPSWFVIVDLYQAMRISYPCRIWNKDKSLYI